MNIIFDNIIFSLQRSGGGSVYWAELIKRFNDNNNDHVIFYDQEAHTANIFRNELKLKNLRRETFLSLKIRRYLNLTKPIQERSIFHSSYFRISTSKKAINVTTVHDFTTEKFRTGLARWVNLQQKKHAVMNSMGIVCISENTRKDLLHFIPQVDPNKIKVIYNGVSDDFFKINNDFSISEKDERFSNLENGKYLLYIGHRTSYKNFPIAVKAAAKLKNEYKLVVVGEPFTLEEKKAVEDYLGSDYLQLAKLRNHELNYLYNKAFALLYPSLYEGFGIPIVEAMKTNCPVIASKNSSIPEVAGDGAILFENIDEEKIVEGIRKLEIVEYRKSLISRGSAQSEKFNWNHTYREYIDFYKSLYDEK